MSMKYKHKYHVQCTTNVKHNISDEFSCWEIMHGMSSGNLDNLKTGLAQHGTVPSLQTL